MELLAPAGNYACMVGAFNAGADAVYLGGNSYGARAYADNFSSDEILKAIDYANILNKKLYLTVNTLIKDKEIDSVLDFVEPFYLNGLNGVIIQDTGLISVFKDAFPGLELHASTQCYITGVNSALFFKNLGCNRVVLARELGIEEIKNIKKETGLEIETFIHGSMCYSYSGDCLFSSCLGSRSANRGRCAGPCRLEYSTKNALKNNEQKTGYFLSMKDQCTISLIPRLIEAGIDSLKIEGRMKKPEYSAFVTSMYRKYIDLYRNGFEAKVNREDLNDLRSIYLRSDIQEGYYERIKGKEMISVSSPGYYGNNEDLMRLIKEKYLKDKSRLGVDSYFSISAGNPVSLTMSANDKYVTVEGPLAENAINNPITDEQLFKALSKLGDSDFVKNDINIDNDKHSFVALKDLNEVRRKACMELSEEILKDFRREKHDRSHSVYDKSEESANRTGILFVRISTMEQFKALKKSDKAFETIINYDIWDEIGKACDTSSYYLELPFVQRMKNNASLASILRKSSYKGIVCHNLEQLQLVNDMHFKTEIISGPEIYNWNRYSVDLLNDFSSKHIISYELSEKEIKDVICDNSIMTIYGRIPLMVTQNCVQNTSFGCKKDGKATYVSLTDRKKLQLPVYLSCKNCYNVIYNAIRTSLHDSLIKNEIESNYLLISFTDEKAEEAVRIIDYYENLIKGQEDILPFKDFTKSYYVKGVE